MSKPTEPVKTEEAVAVELLSEQERNNASQQNGTNGCAPKQNARWGAMQWWKKTLIILSALVLLTILVFFSVILIRTALAGPPPPSAKLQTYTRAIIELVDDGKGMERAQRLAGALKIATVSNEEPTPEDDKYFLELHKYIQDSFHLVHSSSFIRCDVIRNKSLLYTVTGTHPDKLPYLLASHLDVVPADPDEWEVAPFGGQIVNDTYIYGRGALDNKGGVMGILEAVEYMIRKGERPQRTFYIAFGHDEELTGINGALEIAKELRRRGVKGLDFIVDEGPTVVNNMFPGTDKNVAIIGVTEKGYLTLKLTAHGTAGHSSFPPWETAIVRLADAVSRVEKHKLPSLLGKGPERFTFEYLAPQVSFFHRIIYSNMDLFADCMATQMETNPLTNAMVRTTTAITMFNGGFKSNVVPGTATAMVNLRIHPSQSVADVLDFITEVVDDSRVLIDTVDTREPHPSSPFGPDDLPYHMVRTSIEQTFSDTIVVPGVSIGNTDMKHYLNFTSNIYRFFPSISEPIDLARYHGNDERISVANYGRAVSFYYRIIKNSELVLESVPNIE